MEKLTPQEEEAMLAIWKAGEANVKQILDIIEDPKPNSTTEYKAPSSFRIMPRLISDVVAIIAIEI